MDKTIRFSMASNLHGIAVHDRAAERLGRVQDLLLDLETGRVAAVLLSLERDSTDSTPPLYAVPWEVFDLDLEEGVARLDVDRERLEEAPPFEPKPYIPHESQDWLESMYQQYEQPPYWQIG